MDRRRGVEGPADRPGLLRVTAVSSTRRVDVVLPVAVPVAELVPELARALGLLDTNLWYGLRLVTLDGRELEERAGLAVQGVEDGDVLTLSVRVSDRVIYDDIVEAMADVVEHDLEPWSSDSARRTAMCASAALLALGALALVMQHRSSIAAGAAGLAALGLLAGSIALSHLQDNPHAAVAVAWLGTSYGAVAGLTWAWSDVPFGYPAAAAGGAALLTGAVALIGLAEGRTLLIPAVVMGTLLLAAGLAIQRLGLDPALVLTSTVVFLVLVADAFPWLALGATSTDVDQLATVHDVGAAPSDIDAERLRTDMRTAHDILVGVSAAVGLLLVLVAPLAVRLGVSGALAASMACLVVMLRTRRYYFYTEVLVGLLSGVLGLLFIGTAALWLHHDWRPFVTGGSVAAGAALLTVTVFAAGPSARRARLGDLAESAALLSLAPLLVASSGLLDVVGP